MALCMTQPSSFRNQDAIRFYIILQFFDSTKILLCTVIPHCQRVAMTWLFFYHGSKQSFDTTNH